MMKRKILLAALVLVCSICLALGIAACGASVDSVSLSSASLTLTEGDTATLTATVSPEGEEDMTLTWTSSNDSVASVSSAGLVTAVAEGSATITVTATLKDSSMSATCSVTVNPRTYAVTLDVNGGDELSSTSATVSHGHSYTLAVPTKTGYSFAGWYSGDTQLTDGTGASLSVWGTEDNVTLTARWTANEYGVQYSLNGGWFEDNADDADTSAIALADADESYSQETGDSSASGSTAGQAGSDSNDTWTNGEITGSNESQSGTTGQAGTDESGTTWDNEATGGSGSTSFSADIYVTYDASFTLAVPVRTGYEFTGWYYNGEPITDADGNGLGVWNIAANITVQAVWLKVICTVTLVPGEGTISSGETTVDVTYGSSYTLPVPAKACYEFVGWYYGETQLTDAEGNSLEPWNLRTDAVVYAEWTGKNYTVTLDPDGGTLPGDTTATVTYNETYTLEVPVREGYTFAGWYNYEYASDDPDQYTPSQYTDADGTSLGPWYIDNDLTLIAEWNAIDYTVTYDTAGGTILSGVQTETVTYDCTYVLATPDREGYTFTGWYLEDGTQLTDSTGASLKDWNYTEDKTVIAHWTVTEYTITCNAGEGTFSDGRSEYIITVTYGSSYTLPVPAKACYEFVGWYYGETQLTDTEGNSLEPWNISADADLYAEWTGKNYTVTLDPGEGTLSGDTAVTVTYNETYTLEVPEREGYTFDGWYNYDIANDDPDQYTPSQYTDTDGTSLGPWRTDSNLILIAVWSPIDYIVTYDTAGGTISSEETSETVTYGDYFTFVVPTRTGYAFTGWYLEDGTQLTYSDGESLAVWSIANNVTVTAGWINFEPVTITLSSSNTSGNDEFIEMYVGEDVYTEPIEKYSTGDKVTIDAKLYIGYQFDGWFDGEDCVSASASYTFTLTADVNYVAKYSLADEFSYFNFKSTFDTCTVSGLKDSSVTNLVIPEGVTAIDSEAFTSKTRITSVTISTTVTSIGSYAFQYCTSLNTVTFEDGSTCTSIGYQAFSGCKSLTSFVIPDSVLYLYGSVFINCTALESITIGSGVVEIDAYTFSGCKALTSAYFKNPDGWTWNGRSISSDVLSDPNTAAEKLKDDGYTMYAWKRSDD